MPSIKIDKDKLKIRMIYAGIYDFNQLSKSVGISRRTIGNILDGKNWTINNLSKIAITLGCHPFDLLTVEGFPSPKAYALASA